MEPSDSNDSRAELSAAELSGVEDSDLSYDDSQSGHTQLDSVNDASVNFPHSRAGPALPAFDISTLRRMDQGHAPPDSFVSLSSLSHTEFVRWSQAQVSVTSSGARLPSEEDEKEEADRDGKFDDVPADLRFLLQPEYDFVFDMMVSFLRLWGSDEGAPWQDSEFGGSEDGEVLADRFFWMFQTGTAEVKRLVLVEEDWQRRLLAYFSVQLDDVLRSMAEADPNWPVGEMDCPGLAWYRKSWSAQLALCRQWNQMGNTLSLDVRTEQFDRLRSKLGW